jgi:hypothetical protein
LTRPHPRTRFVIELPLPLVRPSNLLIVRLKVAVKQGGVVVDTIKPERVSFIIERVATWFKANQIHAWFVENVQDGEDECLACDCASEKLVELLAVITRVLADESLAPELLPTCEGFFFGSDEYDEYYFVELRDTMAVLTAVLAETEASDDYYYHANW